MRLSYSIQFEDFKALQRPFTLKAGDNAGFKGALVACALIALLGVFCLMNGFGLAVGGFLIGLGAVASGAAYLYEQRSVAAKKRTYEKNLEASYQRIHCRDLRGYEADQNGFTMSCKCETVSRPWAELTSFSENNTHFALGTKMGMQILPKSAFASTADVTEFRAFVNYKFNQGKLVTSPHFDITFQREDYRWAQLLHICKGGGWRYWARLAATYACVVYGTYILCNSIARRNEAVRFGIVGGLVAFSARTIIMKHRRNDYLGTMRVYFSQEGLHAQYPSTQSKRPWSQFIGYLEDGKVLLLYESPKQYTVMPERVLTGPAAQFKAAVAARLPRYDYRNSTAAIKVQPAN